MKKIKNIGLISSFRKTIVVSMIFLFVTSVAGIVTMELIHMSERHKNSQHQKMEEVRTVLKDEVDHLTANIRRIQQSGRSELEDLLEQKVDFGINVAKGIYNSYRGLKSDKEMISLIAKSLKHQKFFDDRGYYFITTTKGTAVLMPSAPDRQGKSVLGMKDVDGRFIVRELVKICNSTGFGTIKYKMSKPYTDGAHFNKLSYVKRFKSLGICIGTGEYLDDHVNVQKKKVLESLGTDHHFNDQSGFVGSYEGISLYGPARGKNMYFIRDVEGRFVVQELINTARDGGGFVTYRMPKGTGNDNSLKLSYVAAIPEWEWYIGAGRFIDSRDMKLGERDTHFAHHLFELIAITVAYNIFVLLIVFIVSRRIARKINNQIHHFTDELQRGETSELAQHNYFVELNQLIRHVSDTISSKQKTEMAYEKNEYKLKDTLSKLESRTNEVEGALEAKSSFLANMSHEIRTPLNSIVGMSEILVETPLNKNQKEYVQILKHSSEHLHFLINDILDYSKLEAGALQFEHEILNLHATCEDVISIVAVRFPSVIFSLNYRNNVPHFIESDQLRLRQVLLNILNNAGKATNRGEVALLVELTTEDRFAIRVVDTGIGISESKLDTIFDVFTQLDGSFTKDYEGTGLGLAISKSIVENLGGQIDVASKEKLGSTFSLLFSRSLLSKKESSPLFKSILEGKSVGIFAHYPMESESLTEFLIHLGATVKIHSDNELEGLTQHDVSIVALGIHTQQNQLFKELSKKGTTLLWTAENDTAIEMDPNSPLSVMNKLKRPLLHSSIYHNIKKLFQGVTGKSPSDINIVIIDSDQQYLSILKDQVLDRLGFNLFVASSIDEAIKHDQGHSADILLFSDELEAVEVSRFMDQYSGDNMLSACILSSNGEMPEDFSRDKKFEGLYLLNKLSSKEDIYDALYGFVENSQRPREEGKSGEDQSRKVLVVDDNSSNLMLVELMLKGFPLEVISVDSALKAYEQIALHPDISLVFMDIQMPEIDGMTAIKQIRQNEVESGAWPIPIFALTAYALKEEHDKIMSSGCNGILTKPVKKHVIQDFVRDFFQLK